MKIVKETKDIMINGLIQEDVTIVNIYVTSTGATNHIRQMLTTTKREINSNTVTARDFNTTTRTKG